MATANGSSPGATPGQRDLHSIPFRGHRIYVWRQPEPTKHAFAWRVVRDGDQHEIANGEAGDDVDAWLTAQATVPGDEQDGHAAADDRDDIERLDRLTFGNDFPMLDFSPEVVKALPEVVTRAETMHRCAYGLDAILRLQRAASMRRELYEAGNDVEVLRPYIAGGLQYAAEALVGIILTETDALSGLEVRHG